MSFLLYIIGFIVFIAGLAWLATVVGASQTYIMIGAVILLGIGIFTAVSKTRSKDPPAARAPAPMDWAAFGRPFSLQGG